MLYGRDKSRLDPADAAPRLGNMNAGLWAGQEPQGLEGILIKYARAAELHPADRAHERARSATAKLDPEPVRDIAER
jgi:hypothetical protein